MGSDGPTEEVNLTQTEEEHNPFTDHPSQYHVMVSEREKNAKLMRVLRSTTYHRAVVLVWSNRRAMALSEVLRELKFDSRSMYSVEGSHPDSESDGSIQAVVQSFGPEAGILVALAEARALTSDTIRPNLLINYDMPDDAESYLGRVGPKGHVSLDGVVISFAASSDAAVLLEIQEEMPVNIVASPPSSAPA